MGAMKNRVLLFELACALADMLAPSQGVGGSWLVRRRVSEGADPRARVADAERSGGECCRASAVWFVLQEDRDAGQSCARYRRDRIGERRRRVRPPSWVADTNCRAPHQTSKT